MSFRKAGSSEQVVYQLLALHGSPTVACLTSPSILVAVVNGTTMRSFNLDTCFPPDVAYSPLAEVIDDLCYTTDYGTPMLITCHHLGWIHIRNMDSKKCRWKDLSNTSNIVRGVQKSIRPISVTSDGHGHLFVSDNANMCVHMLSLRDWWHIGIVMGPESGIPRRIRWCHDT